MTPPPLKNESAVDADHLSLLVIFHYVIAGTSLLGLLFIGVHYLFFTQMVGRSGAGSVPGVLYGLYAVMALVAIAAAILNFLSARFIKQRQNRTFSLIVAGINCLQIPLGLALGIFTFIVLMRPTVQHSYALTHPAP